MSKIADAVSDVLPAAPSRRAVLRGGLVGSAGLAAAALLGCSSTEKPTPGGAPAAAGASTGEKLLNAAVVALNDPKLPYPFRLSEADTTPVRGGAFVHSWSLDTAGLDPTLSTSTGFNSIPGTVCNQLVQWVHGAKLHPFKMEVEPELARSWESSPDGLTITFKLPPNVKWQNKAPLNGRPFTAEDIRLVYQRDASGTSVLKDWFDNVDKMTAVDATTFQVKLKRPQPDFIIPLAGREATIYPMELVDNGWLKGIKDIIGTGPYMTTEIKPGTGTKYVRNPDYWEAGKPYFDTMETKFIVDPAASLAAFRAGQTHYLHNGPAKKKESDALVASMPGLKLIWSGQGLVGGSAIGHINMANPHWQDERVRRAMLLALDRERYSAVVTEGYGVSLRTPPWPFIFDKMPTGAEAGPYQRFAPDEARKLLAAAGMTNFSFEYLTSTNASTTTDFLVDAYKTAAGITMQLKTLDYIAYYSQYQANKFPDTAAGYVGGYSADAWYRDFFKTGGVLNHQNLSDPQIDTWADQQSSELDPKKRREILRKIWDLDAEKAYHPFEQVATVSAANAWVPGLRNATQGNSPYAAITEGTRYFKDSWFEK